MHQNVVLAAIITGAFGLFGGYLAANDWKLKSECPYKHDPDYHYSTTKPTSISIKNVGRNPLYVLVQDVIPRIDVLGSYASGNYVELTPGSSHDFPVSMYGIYPLFWNHEEPSTDELIVSEGCKVEMDVR